MKLWYKITYIIFAIVIMRWAVDVSNDNVFGVTQILNLYKEPFPYRWIYVYIQFRCI